MPANSMLTHHVDVRRARPGRWPTIVRASATSLSVMPAEFIRLAASRKNGTASRMKEL